MENKIRKPKIKKNSIILGSMLKGCSLCTQGKKLVIFITGICPKNCFYCPVSLERKNKDIIYANEMPVNDLKDIVKEGKLSGSCGASLTGGDPLTKFNRVIKTIKLLKKEFGNNFHIHLYTSLDLINENKIKKLEDAGLDEIRFHLDLNNDKLWPRIKIKTKIPKSVEIPVIPDQEKKLTKLIDYINNKVTNLQLNEFEITTTNAKKFEKKGYVPKDDVSYGIKGSEQLAKKLIEYCAKNTNLNVLYCSAKLKDTEQLRQRIKLRAKISAKPFDIVTKEGTFIRGAIYLKEILPEFNYENKLKKLRDNKKILERLKKAKNELIKKLKIKSDKIDIDKHKLRLITGKNTVKKFKKKIKESGYIPAIVEEHPTYDQFEIENEYL